MKQSKNSLVWLKGGGALAQPHSLASPRFSPLAGLRVRLMLFVLLAVLPILGIMLYAALESRQQQADKVEDEVSTVTQLAVDNHEKLIEGARQLLISLAESSEIQHGEAAACNQKLTSLLEQYQGYTTFAVANLDGVIFCSAIPLSEQVNVAHQTWFPEAVETRDFVIDTYRIGQISGKAHLPLSYPVLDAAGRVQGVIVAGLDLKALNQSMAQTPLPPMAALIVIDRNGTILARYPNSEEWIGKTILTAPLIEAILTRSWGVVEVPDFDNITRLYAFSPLRHKGEKEIYLGVGVPRQAAFAQINRSWARNLAGLGLIGLLALGVAWWGSDVLVLRPINALIRATQELRHNLGARTGLAYDPGELGQLARTFDEMAATLEQRETERQRTHRMLEEQAATLREQARLLELAPDAITVRTMNNTLIFWNRGAEEMYGWTRDEALGRDAPSLLQTGYLQPLPQIEATLLQQERWEGELIHNKRDGTPIIVSSRWALSRDESGQAVGILEINNDITERKRSEQAQRILAGAGKLLSSSFEDSTPLARVTRLVVPHLADWCTIHVIEEDGSISQLGLAHVDPAKIKWARRLQRRYPPDWQAPTGVPNVLRTGQSEFYPDISDELIEAVARDADHLRLLRELNMKSAMIVPLLTRERTVGAMTFVWAESGRRYKESDLALAEELGRRAALAVENTRLYRETRILNSELEQRVIARTAELWTANVRLEQEMAEHRQTQAELVEMQRRLMEGIEAERLHLARELHDGPVQDLYSVSYSLSGLQEVIPDETDQSQLAAAKQTLHQVIHALRTTSGEL
ncbi:MAG: PAS domain S-box protein, partial [Chloroflexota bacterium]